MRGRGWVRAAPTLLILVLFMLLCDGTGVILLTLAAAGLHECGHLLAARLLKIRVRGMRLDFFGARLEIEGYMISFGKEWLLCAAGPITSLLAALLGALFWSAFPAVQMFSCASLVLGLINLLPIRSFDGGRMLECSLCVMIGPQRTQLIMRGISLVFLFLLWSLAVYFLLRAGDGVSLFCFSLGLFLRFFDGEEF